MIGPVGSAVISNPRLKLPVSPGSVPSAVQNEVKVLVKTQLQEEVAYWVAKIERTGEAEEPTYKRVEKK